MKIRVFEYLKIFIHLLLLNLMDHNFLLHQYFRTIGMLKMRKHFLIFYFYSSFSVIFME